MGHPRKPLARVDRLHEPPSRYGGAAATFPGAKRRRRLPTRPRRAGAQLGWDGLRQLVDLYSSHLLALNRAAGTLEAYRRDLEHFFSDCQRRTLIPRELSRIDLLNYLASLVHGGYGASTRARKTVAIRRFFQFLADGGFLRSNPFGSVPSPRLERLEQRVLSEPEYQRLRVLARRAALRDWAIVELLLQTGLRASELCGLRQGDATVSTPTEHGCVLVRQGKGKKDRTVPLNSVAERALQAYLRERTELGPRDPVFVTRKGTALTRQGLGSLLGRLYARVGIDRASVHTLRHTFATHSLRKGVSLPVVKEVLGHSSLVSTARYIHTLRDAMWGELEKHAL